VALVANAPHPEAAKKFLGYLAGTQAGAVFTRHGFIVLPAADK
jgi:ABC-type Fe3+ transport system substrate-binding protein